MALSKEMRMRFFHEYLFAKSFERLNETRTEIGAVAFSREDGQTMHDRMVQQLGSSGSFDNVNGAQFISQFNAVSGVPLLTREIYNQYAEEFARYTGVKLKNRTIEFRDRLMVPVSRFDTGFSEQSFGDDSLLYVDDDAFDNGIDPSVRFYADVNESYVPIDAMPEMLPDMKVEVVNRLNQPEFRTERLRYFNEYLFARAFDELNISRVDQGQAALSQEEGQALHEELLGRIGQQGDFGAASGAQFMEQFNDVTGSDILTHAFYNQTARDFSSYTGTRLKANDVEIRPFMTLPISTFDHRYSDRQFDTVGSVGQVDIGVLTNGLSDDMTFYSDVDGYVVESDAHTVAPRWAPKAVPLGNELDMEDEAGAEAQAQAEAERQAVYEAMRDDPESAPAVEFEDVPLPESPVQAETPDDVDAFGHDMRMTYFNEFVFARTFRRMNEEKQRMGEPLTMVSEGRVMRQRLIDALIMDGEITDPSNLGAAGRGALLRRMNELFGEYAPNEGVYTLYAQEFSDYTGIPLRNQEKVDKRDAKLPVSPFMFENRSTFRNLGSEMGYVDFNNWNDLNNPDVVVYRERRDEMTECGPVVTKDDITGLTRLQNFMTQAEYSKAQSWLSGLEDDDYVSAEGIDRAVAILEHLQGMGVEFEIEPDDNPGQLKAKLKHEGMDIRILDKADAEGYIGRIYSSGTTIRYSVNVNERNGYRVNNEDRSRASFKSQAYADATIAETLDLIDYSMGRVVHRRDGVDLNVGEPRVRRVTNRLLNDAYLSSGGMFSAIATRTVDGHPVVMRVAPYVSDNFARTVTTAASARAKLGESIESARESFAEQLNVDYLIEAARNGEEPEFSGDDGIAATQAVYWEVLTGSGGTLLRPGLQQDEFDDVAMTNIEQYAYQGSPEEIVRQHVADSVDYYVGSATKIVHDDFDSEGRPVQNVDYSDFSFDPVMVSKYMRSGGSAYTNDSSIVEWFKMSELSDDVLKGNSFYNKLFKDKIVQFDEASAVVMSRIGDPVAQAALQAIKETLSTTGIKVEDKDILMDSNGIVHYKARRTYGETVPVTSRMTDAQRADRESKEVFEGEIGQIFLPESNGLVKTEFNGSDNYYFAPGYRAYVVPQKSGEHLSLEERTRLKGYEQVLCDSIRQTVRQDVMSRARNVGSVASLNNVYHQLYDTRFDLDYLEKAQQEQMDQDLLDATIETVTRRVRYSSEIRDGSTINADYEEKMRGDNVIQDNDNYRDPYLLTGKRNVAILSPDGDGYFDISATGTAYNQGVTRFLTADAEVTPDGRILKGSMDGKTPLMMHECCRYMDNVPFDRRQMTFGNLIRAACITKNTKTAQMTFGGWTFDDGYVVSKEFAENYKVLGSDGNMRALVKGDKLSDMNGNKGVISLVVDRNMDPDEAKAQGIDKPVAWFRANPELEVVGAPFAAPSRFNAGSARELMERPEDLHGPNGEVFEGCMGSTHYIVTHMIVDEKTHVYGEEELAQGKGRKASAQLAWALDSQKANEVLRECYGSNSGAFQNLREMMISMGVDMDETGTMHMGYEPHNGEVRKVFELPDVKSEIVQNKAGKNVTKSNISEIKNKFLSDINKSGGMLEIPFPLKMPSGEMTPTMDSIPGMEDRKTTAMENGQTTYMLPILSAHLRTGQELDDGSTVNHDYTRFYMNMAEDVCKWKQATEAGDAAKAQQIQRECQAEFDKITGDLSRRVFSGKHNYFRDHIMANRLPNSATAVWTADPRLDIDQVAMGSTMAESIGVKEGDYVLCWRDPMLRDAGVRYNKVKIDDTLVGVAINPVMDKGYDGDFDGDSIAVVALKSDRAKADAITKLSVAANVIDLGSVDENGKYNIMMNDGLDLKSAQWARPELKEWYDGLTEWANDLDPKVDNALADRRSFVADLNAYVHDALDNEYGTDMVSFKDMKSHMASIEHMVIDGAKGSHEKLGSYAKYMGITYEMKEVDGEQRIDLDSIVDHGHSLAERKDDTDVQYATAVKSFGTGIAGMYSQRGMSVLRNHCPKAVLELTYPVTQAILQAKHDPVDALHKYEVLKGSARKLWQGRLLEEKQGKNGISTWKEVYGPDGQPVQATTEEFKKQFIEMYTSKKGLNVKINPKYVDEVASVLTDSKTGRIMNLEEEAKERLASPMDKMAYGGTFETVRDLAKEKKNLFEGQYSSLFTPYIVKSNVKAVEKGYDPKAVVKSDTKENQAGKQSKQRVVAVVVGAPEPVPVAAPVASGDVQSEASGSAGSARPLTSKDVNVDEAMNSPLPCEQAAQDAENKKKNNNRYDDGDGGAGDFK